MKYPLSGMSHEYERPIYERVRGDMRGERRDFEGDINQASNVSGMLNLRDGQLDINFGGA